ncbi:uncharacterized protein BXZ73DRAFT_30551, partial [Epithele typhae]|uniref:uncharacterized protein n=1 Tax=Epithele typhae TaxID=378194 RepID=UPI002007AF83
LQTALSGLLAVPMRASRYVNRASVLFHHVERTAFADDGSLVELSPLSVLQDAITRSGSTAWSDGCALLPDTATSVRWGPHAADSTTATLFVDVIDDEDFKTLRALNGSRLSFDIGPRACVLARVPDRPIQCSNCQQFGHAALRCRAPPACGYCAGAHHTHHH